MQHQLIKLINSIKFYIYIYIYRERERERERERSSSFNQVKKTINKEREREC